MESEESSRPSIAFPLGLALLIILLVLICGSFTCYLHWHKLRSFFRPSFHQNSRIQEDLHKSATPHLEAKQIRGESLPVLMPGDDVPKFIAVACPCEPPVIEKLTVTVHNPPSISAPLYYN